MGAEPQDSAGYYGNHQLRKPEWEVCQGPPKYRNREGPRAVRCRRIHSRPTLGVRHSFSEKKPRQREDESALLGTQHGGLARGRQALKQ